jgi:hypothetical protein
VRVTDTPDDEVVVIGIQQIAATDMESNGGPRGGQRRPNDHDQQQDAEQ